MPLNIPFFDGGLNVAQYSEPKVIAITNLSRDVSESPGGNSGNHRTKTFPAFIRGDIAESLTPGWDQTPIYGRVDSVARYTNTTRTVSFAFYLMVLRDDEFRTAIALMSGGAKTLAGGRGDGGVTLRQLGSARRAGKGVSDFGFRSAAANREAAAHALNFAGVGSAQGQTSIDYISKNFDSLSDVKEKLLFLRKLVYPRQGQEDGKYIQPPMIEIDVTDQFKGVKGYLTDLSISHLIESGAGVDILGKRFNPLAYEIAMNMTILHSKSPNNKAGVDLI